METKPINSVTPPAFNAAENNAPAPNKNNAAPQKPASSNNSDAKTVGAAAAAAGVAGMAAGAAGFFVGREMTDDSQDLEILDGQDIAEVTDPENLNDVVNTDDLADVVVEPAPAPVAQEPAPAPAPEPEPETPIVNEEVEPGYIAENEPEEDPFPEPEMPEVTVEPDPEPVVEEPVVPENPLAQNEVGTDETNNQVNEEVDELLAENLVDPDDIDTPNVFTFNDMDEVATIDGDMVTSATFTDEAGNEFAMIDLDNDNVFDIIVDNDGDLVSYVNGITTDDVMEEITDADSYLAADDTEIPDDFSDDMLNDLIS